VFRRNPIIETAPLDEEIVLFHPATNRFIVLNGTGAFLWGLLSDESPASALAQAMCDQFAEIEYADALQDVEQMLGEMVSQELVVAVSETQKTQDRRSENDR